MAPLTTDPSDPERPWWRAPLAELLTEWRATPAGLTVTEARRRLAECGENTFRDERERSLVAQFASRFRNPLVLTLLAASAVAAATGDTPSFVIILVMVTVSVAIDFVQEHHAGKAARALRQSVQIRAVALRDGAPVEIPVREVVPGDVVLLSAGSLVPADGRLLEARDLFVNQALLTGESFPVEKHAGEPTGANAELTAATSALFMGTSVVSGTARLLVGVTGKATAVGQIAHTLALEPPPTSFEIGARQFGLLIMRLTMLMVLFVLLVNVVMDKPLLGSFLFAVALAVGLTPELLPMVISITLARGALRLARRGVIVKRLPAIQNLGAMDVLCTDKTGTLTEAKISLERHVDLAGTDSERVLALACLNSHFETGIRSPLDEAILAHRHPDTSRYQKIDEVPFDFERRRVSVLLDDGAARLLIVKGAPEDVLRLSTHFEADTQGTPRPWDDASRAAARARLAELAGEGLRVLGIASRTLGRDHPHAVVGDETELVFAGFAAFLDPPRASAAGAIATLTGSGVRVKIVTGDSEIATAHLCASLGIPVRGVLTGEEISRLSDHALEAQAHRTSLFCRVNPAQKNRIILALKRRRHVVGFLGDGINDAPALHSADVGISVDTAVDVAREAADLILREHDLAVLHEGVIEGRRTFANIRKYILMGTSSNFGNMFSMAGASLFLPFLPMLPTQILLNNALYDVSEVPIPLDDVDPAELRRPQHFDIGFIRNFMWVIGPVSSLFDFATFYVLLAVLEADAALFQTGWFIESLATQVLVIFVIRTRRSPFASRPHPALAATSLGVLAVAIALPYTELGRYFGFQPLPPVFFAILAALTVAYLAIVEVAKRLFYRYAAAPSRGT